MVYGIEKVDCCKETFSFAANYLIVILMFCHCIQQGRTMKHINFEDAFRNSGPERLIYAEISTGEFSNKI